MTAMGNAGMCARACLYRGGPRPHRAAGCRDRPPAPAAAAEAAAAVGDGDGGVDLELEPELGPPARSTRRRTGLTNSKAYLLISRSRCSSDSRPWGTTPGPPSARSRAWPTPTVRRSVAGLIQDAGWPAARARAGCRRLGAPRGPAVQVYRPFPFAQARRRQPKAIDDRSVE